MRKVIFVSTQTNAKQTVESSATNFEALMQELGASISNTMRYYVKETRNSLEHPQAELPEGDFTLVASPRNNKAAVYNSVEDIPTSQVREAKTRINNILNAILEDRGEDITEDDDENCEDCLDSDLLDELEDIQGDFF